MLYEIDPWSTNWTVFRCSIYWASSVWSGRRVHHHMSYTQHWNSNSFRMIILFLEVDILFLFQRFSFVISFWFELNVKTFIRRFDLIGSSSKPLISSSRGPKNKKIKNAIKINDGPSSKHQCLTMNDSILHSKQLSSLFLAVKTYRENSVYG